MDAMPKWYCKLIENCIFWRMKMEMWYLLDSLMNIGAKISTTWIWWGIDSETFLDWTRQMKTVLDYKGYDDRKRLELLVLELRKLVALWYENLKSNMRWFWKIWWFLLWWSMLVRNNFCSSQKKDFCETFWYYFITPSQLVSSHFWG